MAFPVPLVTACSGHALALGIFLAMVGDYAVGAAKPIKKGKEFKIGANEVAIGLDMPRPAVLVLQNRLSPSLLNRVAVQAEIFTPAAALAAGILDNVCPADQLLAVATAKAEQLANLNQAAFLATKLRIRGPIIRVMDKAIDDEDIDFRARVRAKTTSKL